MSKWQSALQRLKLSEFSKSIVFDVWSKKKVITPARSCPRKGWPVDFYAHSPLKHHVETNTRLDRKWWSIVNVHHLGFTFPLQICHYNLGRIFLIAANKISFALWTNLKKFKTTNWPYSRAKNKLKVVHRISMIQLMNSTRSCEDCGFFSNCYPEWT